MTTRRALRLLLTAAVLAPLVAPAASTAQDLPFSEFWEGMAHPGGRLGLEVLPMTPALRQHFGVGGERGVLVADVEPESSAAAAGIEAGDVIVEAGGEGIKSPKDLVRRVRRAPAGETIELALWRKGEPLRIEVEVRGRPWVPLWERRDSFRPWFDRAMRELREHVRELERRLHELERRIDSGDVGSEQT